MLKGRWVSLPCVAVAALSILANQSEAGHFYRLHYHAAIQGRQQQCVQAQEHGCLATLEAWDMGQDDGKVTFCGPLRLLNVCTPKSCWHCDGACGGNVVKADVWQIGEWIGTRVVMKSKRGEADLLALLDTWQVYELGEACYLPDQTPVPGMYIGAELIESGEGWSVRLPHLGSNPYQDLDALEVFQYWERRLLESGVDIADTQWRILGTEAPAWPELHNATPLTLPGPDGKQVSFEVMGHYAGALGPPPDYDALHPQEYWIRAWQLMVHYEYTLAGRQDELPPMGIPLTLGPDEERDQWDIRVALCRSELAQPDCTSPVEDVTWGQLKDRSRLRFLRSMHE